MAYQELTQLETQLDGAFYRIPSHPTTWLASSQALESKNETNRTNPRQRLAAGAAGALLAVKRR